MSDSQRAGRAILIAYITLILLVSVGVVVLYVIYRGTNRVPVQVVRVALTVWLCYALYGGSRIAKRLAIVLTTLGGALALSGVLIDDPVAAVLMGGMAVLYLSFATVLLGSRQVNDFLGRHRDVEPTETLSSGC